MHSVCSSLLGFFKHLNYFSLSLILEGFVLNTNICGEGPDGVGPGPLTRGKSSGSIHKMLKSGLSVLSRATCFRISRNS